MSAEADVSLCLSQSFILRGVAISKESIPAWGVALGNNTIISNCVYHISLIS